jgi:CheY-like chemotaxis protein
LSSRAGRSEALFPSEAFCRAARDDISPVSSFTVGRSPPNFPDRLASDLLNHKRKMTVDMGYGDMMVHDGDCDNDVRAVRPAAPTTRDRPRILIAEDDEKMRQLLAKVVHADGYDVVECRDGIDLFRHLEAFVGRQAALDFEAIISDILMPGPTGLEILEALHDRTGFPPVILITAFGDKGTHARAQKAKAVAVLDKPFEIAELLSTLHATVPHRPPERAGMDEGPQEEKGIYESEASIENQ